MINELSASLLQSSESHEPSEIMLKSEICWLGAQKKFLLLSMLQTVVQLNIFCGKHCTFFSRIIWWI